MDNTVDLVFISYVLHQSGEKYKIISEAYRVFKNNMYVAILTSSHEQLRNDLFHQYFPGILEINLERFLSLDNIREILLKACFKKVNFLKISVNQKSSIEEIIARMKEKCLSVTKLLSEEEFQSSLKTFENRMKSNYKNDIIYKNLSYLIIATKPT